MQILPVSTAASKNSVADLITGSQSAANAGAQFADIFNKRYQSMRQTLASLGVTDTSDSSLGLSSVAFQTASQQTGVTTSDIAVQTATQASGQTAVKAMSDSTRLDAMQNVKMTQEDFAELRPKLEKAGLDKDSLDEMQKKVSSPEGMTWGQFVHTLQETVSNQVRGKVELTDQEKQSLGDFFTKLGFDSKQAQEMANSMAAGKGAQVWKQVDAKLASLSPDETFSFSQDELQALSKAMRLTPEAQTRLAPALQTLENGNLNAKGVANALGLMRAEEGKQLAKVDEVMHGVRQAVGEVIADSADRFGLARQTVEGQLNARQLAVEGNSESVKGAQAAGKDAGTDQAKAGAQTTGDPARPGQTAQTAQNGQNARNDLAGWSGQQNQGKGGSSDQKSAQDKAWSDFWGKLRADDAGSGAGGLSGAGKGVGLGGFLGQTQTPSAAGAQAKTAATGLDRTQAQTLLDQVESGVLRNLGQGTKQLSLELSPDNLGKLNVVLSVKGKEVQAVIKAESPEASKLLSENLAQVKESLERQGLTVAKLEVRTGLSQDQNLGQQWSGTDQHNQAQERRDALGRMRVGSSFGGVGEVLAQDVQSQTKTASSSQGGLDLIA